MTLVGIGGVGEVATSHVALRDDALECGPVWGYNSQGLTNTVRAWLTRRRDGRV